MNALNESSKNLFDVLLDQIRQIVREELEAALRNGHPDKQLFNSTEAANMLGVPRTWLETKARENKVPYRRMGHYVRYSREDIEQIAKGIVDTPEG
jgi:excisionase family DNA binding protein